MKHRYRGSMTGIRFLRVNIAVKGLPDQDEDESGVNGFFEKTGSYEVSYLRHSMTKRQEVNQRGILVGQEDRYLRDNRYDLRFDLLFLRRILLPDFPVIEIDYAFWNVHDS